MRLSFKKYTHHVLWLVYFIGGFVAVILSYNHHWNKEHIGLAFFLGVVLALFMSRCPDEFRVLQEMKEESEHIQCSRFFKVVFIIFLCFSLIASVIFVNSKQNYSLPLQYFLIISLAGVLISIQVLITKSLSKFDTYLMLLEILVLSTIVSASLLFLFPGPYGNDASYHVVYIKNIITSGNIKSYPGQYQNYPIYHLLFAFISLITGIKSLKLIQFVIAIIQILFLIFLFMLIRKLFNDKVALISTLLVSLSPYLLQPRYIYFPCSFTAVFFIFILYLFLYPSSKTFASSLLLIIMLIVTVLSHPLTPAILLVTFLAIYIISKLLQLEKVELSGTNILFISVVTLNWWMKPIGGQQDMFSYLVLSIRNAFETADYTAITRATLAPLYRWSDIILCDLGFTILILLAIIGAFCSLKNLSAMNKLTANGEKILALCLLTLLFVPIPFFLAIVYPQSLPDRWFPFIEVFASIFAGVSVVLIYQMLSKYKLHYPVSLMLLILVFFMITSPVANPNTQIYAKEISGRSALTQSEIDAAEFLKSQHLISIENIHGSTGFMALAFEKVFLDRSKNLINPDNPNTYNSGYIIIRKYDLEKGFTIPLFGKEGKLMKIVQANNKFVLYLNSINKIYINNEVSVYNVVC